MESYGKVRSYINFFGFFIMAITCMVVSGWYLSSLSFWRSIATTVSLIIVIYVVRGLAEVLVEEAVPNPTGRKKKD